MYLKYKMKDHPAPREDVRAVQRMLIKLGYRGLTLPEDREQATVAAPVVRVIKVDGVYGPVTESAVEAFQEEEGIVVDGIVGPHTLDTLSEALARRAMEQDAPAVAGGLLEDIVDEMTEEVVRFSLTRVATNRKDVADALEGEDKDNVGYEKVNLRSDAAAAYCRVRDRVNDAGGMMSSSGGIRSLEAKVSAGRSATSMHYVGRALDLFIFSGMVDPASDPFVITGPDDAGYWTVWVRVDRKKSKTKKKHLKNVVTDRQRDGSLATQGYFLNLTEMMAEEGFKPIRPRKSFLKGGSRIGAEFWHFQYQDGLVRGVSTFGAELKRLYPMARLEDSAPWRHRDNIFGVNWF